MRQMARRSDLPYHDDAPSLASEIACAVLFVAIVLFVLVGWVGLVQP